MYKQIILSLAALALLASCSIKEERYSHCTVPVTVRVAHFSICQEDFPTKAALDVAAYEGVKALTLAFYEGDTEVYKTTQLREDVSTYETFGEFSLSLPMGSYTMVVLGYGLKDWEPAVTLTGPYSATFGENPARETFVATETVTINSTAAVDISATLDRIIAKLQVVSTDGRAANATNVRMTLSAGGKAFNPTTGLATINTGFSNTVNISTAAGTTSSSITYLFLASDEQTLDVTVDVLDAEGQVLSHRVATGVPFQRNRVTKLTGPMYTNHAISGSFQLETDWEEQYDGSF